MRLSAPDSTLVSPEELTSAAGAADRETVKAAQNQLLVAGYSLPRFGADGQFGRETAAAVTRFQRAHQLPETGSFDAKTLGALEKAAASPPSPDYQALFSDGVLKATMAVGYDEYSSHLRENGIVLKGLSERGYREVSPEERKRFSLDDEGRYFTRTLSTGKEQVTVVLELITADTAQAQSRFAKGMQSEVVMYGGHGRYGSGPDFDDIHSTAGNFVIGQPSEAGHVTLGANDLDSTKLPADYQLMFFDGCNTFRYFDDLRTKTPGKSSQNLDLIGSNTELLWNVTAANLLTMLDGVTEQKNLGQLTAELDQVNKRIDQPQGQYFRGDGFEDN